MINTIESGWYLSLHFFFYFYLISLRMAKRPVGCCIVFSPCHFVTKPAFWVSIVYFWAAFYFLLGCMFISSAILSISSNMFKVVNGWNRKEYWNSWSNFNISITIIYLVGGSATNGDSSSYGVNVIFGSIQNHWYLHRS